MDLGTIAFSKRKKAYYARINAEMVSLCRSMPDCVQTDSLLFLLEYSKVHLGDELDLFAHYHAPARIGYVERLGSVIYRMRSAMAAEYEAESKRFGT